MIIYLSYLRFVVVATLLMVMAWQTLFSTTSTAISTNFIKRTSYISTLWPAGRVQSTGASVVVYQEPVYFEVMLPPRAARISVNILAPKESASFSVGVKQTADWNYSFPIMTVNEQAGNNIYNLEVNEFSYVESNHALRFIISAPKINSKNPVIINGLQVSIERKPFSWRSLINSLSTVL